MKENFESTVETLRLINLLDSVVPTGAAIQASSESQSSSDLLLIVTRPEVPLSYLDL